MASSSLIGETAAGLDLGGGAGFFLEKRATVLKVEEVGAEDLTEAVKLRGLPSISLTPREVDAAKEAMID